jgi:hypothetical protein
MVIVVMGVREEPVTAVRLLTAKAPSVFCRRVPTASCQPVTAVAMPVAGTLIVRRKGGVISLPGKQSKTA